MLFNTNGAVLGAIFLAMASSAQAHIVMAEPVPYGQPNNSPLSPDGSDFPCKSVPYTGKMNDWPIGSQQTLKFSGSAVHGGGSCQIVVTTDKEPTKESKWKVIYSIEGGCPGVGGPSEFPFTVPKEVPNGEMTMAFTWFNKIGNREFYMNCAGIKTSGGSDDKGAFEKLPDMALANIAVGEGASCKTSESNDYTFENPGEYKTRIGSGPFVPLCGGQAANGQPGATAPAGGQPAPSGAPAQTPNNGMYTPPASEAPAPSAPVPSAPISQSPQAPIDSAPGVVTSTVRTLMTVTATVGGSPSTPAAQPSQAPMPSAPAAQPSSAPQPSQAPATPGGGNGQCANDGEIVCNGETQFGICNQGTVVYQPVAAGTKCQNGAIAKRDYTHRAQRTRVN